MISRFVRAVASGAAILAITAVARGQATPQVQASNQEEVAEANFQRQMDQFQYSSRVHVNEDIPIDQRLLLDYGGYLTFSYLSVPDSSNNTHVLRDTALVLYGRANLDNAQEVFIRGKINYNDYNADHGGAPDDFGGVERTGEHSDVEEAYYRFDLQRFLGDYYGITTHDDAAAQLGRQTVIWGNGLAFNQDIDGGVLDLSKSGIGFEGVAGVSVPDTIDFDTSRPRFNTRTTRGFFGALISTQLGRHRPYAYFLSERDFNSDNPYTQDVGTGGAPITTDFDYNSDYIGAGSTGSITDRLAYGVEGTFESGSGLSSSTTGSGAALAQATQRYEPISASAGDVRLDYLFPDSHNTRLSAEYIVASGDRDRTFTNTTFGGNKAGTRDLAYNGFGLLNTGLAFAPDVSNVMVSRFGISSQPLNQWPLFRKFEVGTDVFIYDKTVEHAPIDEPTVGSGGDPGNAERFLGWEPDFFMNWQITSDLTLAMRYGVFFPNDDQFSFAHTGVVGSDKARPLFFTGVTYAF